MKVLGIAGPRGSGKSLATHYALLHDPRLAELSFAESIKRMLAVGLDLTHRQLEGDLKEEMDFRYGKSPRELMETLGTEWGRDIVKPRLWLDIVRNRAAELPFVVVSDVRFQEEADWVRSNGKLLHIQGRGGAEADGHQSRWGVPFVEGDLIVQNDLDVDHLKERMRRVVRTVFKPEPIRKHSIIREGDEEVCLNCGRRATNLSKLPINCIN